MRRRIFVPDASVHVYHRGNNRIAIFGEESDCEVFLRILKTAVESYDTAVHGFVLMTTHIHVLATPKTETALAGTMKQLGERYVPYFNRKYRRTGTLWEGRYRSKHIADERQWLTCLRYIEQNPVRAHMVPAPDAYRWSSYSAHARGEGFEWLVPHPVYLKLGRNDEERQAAYRAICAEPLPQSDLMCLRHDWDTSKSVLELAGV
jgi:putative transposase